MPKPAPATEKTDTMENETEIDDFLTAGESSKDGEELLTKWDSGEAEKQVPQKQTHRRSGKYRYGILAGSLVLLLALVGVAFIAFSVGTKIHSAVTDDSALRAYDKQLRIIVAQDPQAFDSPEKADPDFVLNASIWKTVLENGSNYTQYDDVGRTIIPLGDVVDACGNLFGPKCTLQPKNPKSEAFYTYDSGKAQFHVALYSLENTYEPYTESKSTEGDSVVLHVGYIPPTDPARAARSKASSAVGKPTPAKYMTYVLKTNPSNKKEYVYAVKKG